MVNSPSSTLRSLFKSSHVAVAVVAPTPTSGIVGTNVTADGNGIG